MDGITSIFIRILIAVAVLQGAGAGSSAFDQGPVPQGPRLSALLAELSKSFPVIDQKLGLRKLPDNFVLQVVCRDGVLASFHVDPRHHYENAHPEWKEPDRRSWLKTTVFRDVMDRMDKLGPIGRVVHPLSPLPSNAGVTFGFGRFENALIDGAFGTIEPPAAALLTVDHRADDSG